MTGEQIIKANKLCAMPTPILCKECPYHHLRDTDSDCVEVMTNDTVDLINRLQADKEGLINGQETLQKALAESEAKYNEAAKRFYKEGVNDFAERLKNVYTGDKRYDRPNPQTMLSKLFYNITIVAKELRGDAE